MKLNKTLILGLHAVTAVQHNTALSFRYQDAKRVFMTSLEHKMKGKEVLYVVRLSCKPLRPSAAVCLNRGGGVAQDSDRSCLSSQYTGTLCTEHRGLLGAYPRGDGTDHPSRQPVEPLQGAVHWAQLLY